MVRASPEYRTELRRQRYAAPMGFLCRLHYQLEVMQDESDLALTHAASILLERTL
jgi:hypothetical protein